MNWLVRTDKKQTMIFGSYEDVESLVCADCREPVVIGDTGETCGCGDKIQNTTEFGDVRKRFPKQVSESPADAGAGRLISSIRRSGPRA